MPEFGDNQLSGAEAFVRMLQGQGVSPIVGKVTQYDEVGGLTRRMMRASCVRSKCNVIGGGVKWNHTALCHAGLQQCGRLIRRACRNSIVGRA